MRPICGPAARQAIDNLETCDRLSGRNLTNAQVLPSAAYVDRNAPAARTALRRTASFLLVRDVLQDVAAGIPAIMAGGADLDTALGRGTLVTAQLEALHQQVDAGMAAARDKMRNGQRILPFYMRGQAFDHFMQAHVPTLTGIVQSCTQVGAQRTHALEHYLKTIARNYLGATNRLPRGLAPGQFFTALGRRFTQDSIALCLVDYNTLHGTYFDTQQGGCFGAMFIDPEDCSHPFGDPSEGSLDEQFYATGFEHCSLPKKQAAVLILKTFWELNYLEQLVGEFKGKASANPAEAHLAQASELDRNYQGAVQTGDYLDERGLDPANQRKRVIDPVRVLTPVLADYKARTGAALVCDPNLDAWLQSPQFAKDMDSLAVPESRAWIIAVAEAKKALLRTSVFAR